MVDFPVMSDLPKSYSALTEFDFWADVLEERALSQDWYETKALASNEKLQTRLDITRDYPVISRTFSSFFYGVALQHLDVEKGRLYMPGCSHSLKEILYVFREKMILNILRKVLKKTRKTYIQAYRQTEDRRRMHKDALICLEFQMGSKEVLKKALRVKAKEVANRFVKALELEQTANVKMIYMR